MKDFQVCSRLRSIEYFANSSIKNQKDWGCKRYEGTPNKAALAAAKRAITISKRLQRSFRCS